MTDPMTAPDPSERAGEVQRLAELLGRCNRPGLTNDAAIRSEAESWRDLAVELVAAGVHPPPLADRMAARAGEVAEAIRALHQPFINDHDGHIAPDPYETCRHDHKRYPCPTIVALTASGLVGGRADEARAELREAAEWVANSIGYPIETAMPDHPMPAALWSALVDVVHEDADGHWHGNSLDREDVDSWLCEEAGRDRIESGEAS